uniref:Uncharacterized protein n=1 Tax=Arundo donax TaxID=35708 RepID=A0A0A9DFP9_ARUDO
MAAFQIKLHMSEICKGDICEHYTTDKHAKEIKLTFKH